MPPRSRRLTASAVGSIRVACVGGEVVIISELALQGRSKHRFTCGKMYPNANGCQIRYSPPSPAPPRPSSLKTSGQQRRTPTEKTFVYCKYDPECASFCGAFEGAFCVRIVALSRPFIPLLSSTTFEFTCLFTKCGIGRYLGLFSCQVLTPRPQNAVIFCLQWLLVAHVLVQV